MEISYTEGPMNLNWKQIMATVEGDDRFYMDTEEDEVTEKEAGWEFLRMFGKDDDVDEESEEESVYSEKSEQEESVSFISSHICLRLIESKTHCGAMHFHLAI
jgi:nucleosome binding factor SPN SPT16 subunit